MKIFTWIKCQWEWLVLFVVASVGAWLYVEVGQIRADRDDALHAAELICAGIGQPFQPTHTAATSTAGKPVTVNHARGALCQRQANDLASFKAKTDEATAATLAQALSDHDARQNTDSAAARTAAEAASSAAERMEKANAEAERRNIVDREWFAAVNGVAGLRAPTR